MFKVIVGLLIVVAGALMTIKSAWFLRNFGRINWAENKFPSEGGTRFFYKLLGIIIVFLGLSVMTGVWNDILNGVFNLLGGRN